MIENISRQEISMIFRQALLEGLIVEEDTAILFHNLDYLKSRITYLESCFPVHTLHGLAIKSNPLLRILEFTREWGTGVEAATTGEVGIALKAGYRPDLIVFDSPVKTVSDLRFAMKMGVHVNCDNLEELKRVNILLNSTFTSSTFGIRINPQVGVGSILESSVAGEYSKFGVPLKTRRRELEEAFSIYPWLTGIHLHVGSQGCSMKMLVEGVGILYDFALEINKNREASSEKRINIFDIGGGLPISYSYQQNPPRMEDYAEALKVRAPELFNGQEDKRTSGQGDKRTRGQEDKQTSGQVIKENTDCTPPSPHHPITSLPKWHLITEFGRWVYVNSGWTISRVEYVKRDPGISTAMIHVGADLLVRECLNPAEWKHEYSVLDSEGNLKVGLDAIPYNLAGPLCFGGDIVAKQIPLPIVEEGDYIVIHDTGGYTFSMWSRYNSRQTPKILGWRDGKFMILKERETLEEVVGFWE